MPVNSIDLCESVMRLVRMPAKVYQPISTGDDEYCFALPIAESAAEYNGGKAGECYLAAVAGLASLRRSGIVADIVHGVVTCQGERILHGWVEVPFATPDGSSYLCVDASDSCGSTRVALLRDYYRILRVRRVRRYTLDDILKIVQSGVAHCGVWEPPLERCAEMDELANARRNAAGYFSGDPQ